MLEIFGDVSNLSGYRVTYKQVERPSSRMQYPTCSLSPVVLLRNASSLRVTSGHGTRIPLTRFATVHVSSLPHKLFFRWYDLWVIPELHADAWKDVEVSYSGVPDQVNHNVIISDTVKIMRILLLWSRRDIKLLYTCEYCPIPKSEFNAVSNTWSLMCFMFFLRS